MSSPEGSVGKVRTHDAAPRSRCSPEIRGELHAVEGLDALLARLHSRRRAAGLRGARRVGARPRQGLPAVDGAAAQPHPDPHEGDRRCPRDGRHRRRVRARRERRRDPGPSVELRLRPVVAVHLARPQHVHRSEGAQRSGRTRADARRCPGRRLQLPRADARQRDQPVLGAHASVALAGHGRRSRHLDRVAARRRRDRGAGRRARAQRVRRGLVHGRARIHSCARLAPGRDDHDPLVDLQRHRSAIRRPLGRLRPSCRVPHRAVARLRHRPRSPRVAAPCARLFAPRTSGV
jgi:hypothetical protein